MTDPATPQEAQQLLGDYSTEDLEHYATIALNETGSALFEAAPRLAKTIAADTIQYAIEEGSQGVWYLTEYDEYEQHIWSERRDIVEEGLTTLRENWPGNQHRLVARRVSPTWEVKE